MKRRALLVGINAYDHLSDLTWCLEDALEMQRVLEFHEDHSPNFSCRTLLGPVVSGDSVESVLDQPRVTFNSLRTALEELFNFDGMILFYFSGHGRPTDHGVYLVTQDGDSTLPGLLLNDILTMANNSSAEEVVLIIDSCSSGSLGEPETAERIEERYLRPGVTLLAASMSGQNARELNGHGIFTHLVLGALKGGASDVRGQISAASIYAYVEQALGPWDQRPIYKSNASQLSSLRNYTPDVRDEELCLLSLYFPQPDHQFALDPSYEFTRPEAISEHVAIFKRFKRFQVARLLRPTLDEDLYFAAISSHLVELTPLGQFYWLLAKNGLLGAAPVPVSARRSRMPDPASIAQLFHETYERLAPTFAYETREASRVPWEKVPESNKHLMIATVAEVLATLFPPEDPGVVTAPPSTSG